MVITAQFNLFYTGVIATNFRRLLMLESVFMIGALIRVSELIIDVRILLGGVRRM